MILFQVVEIKLQFEIYDKRLKMLSLQKASGKTPAYAVYVCIMFTYTHETYGKH